MRIRTDDLWQSAFVLSKGGSLVDIHAGPNGNGRKKVIFILGGDDVNELTGEFRTGQAMCNVSRLRASWIHLKDEMFKAIKS